MREITWTPKEVGEDMGNRAFRIKRWVAKKILIRFYQWRNLTGQRMSHNAQSKMLNIRCDYGIF